MEKGAKPNDIFADAPIEISPGPGLPAWRPKNFEDNFLGPMTLRKGLEKSRNTVTVRVGQFAGIKKVRDIIKRFGINDTLSFAPSIVLGAIETTLARMTLAYGIIANGVEDLTKVRVTLSVDGGSSSILIDSVLDEKTFDANYSHTLGGLAGTEVITATVTMANGETNAVSMVITKSP